MSPSLSARRVIVGVDPSRHAAEAAEWAAAEAAARNLPLHLLHARDGAFHASYLSPLPYDVYKEREHAAADTLLAELSDVLQRRYPVLTVSTEVCDGTPAEALVAASHEAELLVAGTRGHGGFTGALLGSVSLRLAAHAHCPTVIVRGQTDDFGTGPVVLGVDSGEPPEAITFAFAEAARVHAPLTVVHAWEPQRTYGGHYQADVAMIENSEQALMASLIREAHETFPEVKMVSYLMREHPATALIEASRGARLLVVAAHRHRGPLSVGVGPIVHGLLHHAHAPVAIVPVV